MPIIRNPFRRAPGDITHDEHGRPVSVSADGVMRDTTTSQPVNIRRSDKSPTEYKLSEINDSGVFLPPSPTEKESHLAKPLFRSTRSYASTTSATSTASRSQSHRSVFSADEPFNISRESFESYRRSFDISARSPVLDAVERPRCSLDARQLRGPERVGSRKEVKEVNEVERDNGMEERFEDVGLDEAKPAKKQGFLSRFGHSGSNSAGEAQGLGIEGASRPTSSHFGSQLFGRKRGQSGQGAELGPVGNANGGPAEAKAEGKTER